MVIKAAIACLAFADAAGQSGLEEDVESIPYSGFKNDLLHLLETAAEINI